MTMTMITVDDYLDAFKEMCDYNLSRRKPRPFFWNARG